jgi:hypothetical protein
MAEAQKCGGLKLYRGERHYPEEKTMKKWIRKAALSWALAAGLASSAQAGLTIFQFAYIGAPFGNTATATGAITVDMSLMQKSPVPIEMLDGVARTNWSTWVASPLDFPPSQIQYSPAVAGMTTGSPAWSRRVS